MLDIPFELIRCCGPGRTNTRTAIGCPSRNGTRRTCRIAYNRGGRFDGDPRWMLDWHEFFQTGIRARALDVTRRVNLTVTNKKDCKRLAYMHGE